jgi:hypothetical protein
MKPLASLGRGVGAIVLCYIFMRLFYEIPRWIDADAFSNTGAYKVTSLGILFGPPVAWMSGFVMMKIYLRIRDDEDANHKKCFGI